MTKLETRTRIIEAARLLFKQKGYTAASTRDIAELAGVNHLTLFRHFTNKENLYRISVVEHLTSGDFISCIQVQLTGKLEADLTFIANAYLRENSDKGELFLTSLQESRDHAEAAELIGEIPRQLNAFMVQYLAELQQRQQIMPADYTMLSTLFFSMLNQYILYQTHPLFGQLYPSTEESFIMECVSLLTSRLNT